MEITQRKRIVVNDEDLTKEEREVLFKIILQVKTEIDVLLFPVLKEAISHRFTDDIPITKRRKLIRSLVIAYGE